MKAAAAAFGVFFCGCAAAPPVIQKLRPAGVHASSWEEGTCMVRGGSIVYLDERTLEQAGQRIDSLRGSPQRDTDSLICSSSFTVLIQGRRAIVSVGGDGVLGGRDYLGRLGDSFVLANSYELNLSPIAEDGGVAAQRLSSGHLTLTSRSGRRWEIDLTDPYSGWNVY
ncbi:MAG: hypothetical protein U0R44_07330 [Candidatus Micrarchaeia archaeon]